MKTKLIPATCMLLGGAVAAIVTFINGYDLTNMLKIILFSLIVFLIMGVAIKLILDKYVPYVEKTEEEETAEDGSVIEKTDEEGMEQSEAEYEEDLENGENY